MLKLKPFRQRPGFCGPASLKIVLDYYNFKVLEQEIAKLSGAEKEKGTKPAGLIKALKILGFSGFWKENGKIKDLKYFLKLKLPLIIDWFSETEGHYSVVAGFERDNILLMDPEISGIKKIPTKDFQKIWWDFEGESVKNPQKWHFSWFLVPILNKRKFKVKGKYF